MANPSRRDEKRQAFFVTCGPGLEPLLHEELKKLRISKLERQVGGVRFEGTLHDAYWVNLWVRTGIRVLLMLHRFEARDGDELYRGVSEIDWSRFLTPDGTLRVRAQSRDSVLSHTRFLEQRVKDAVVDQFRARHNLRPSVDKDDADLRIQVHVSRNRVTLSVDTSGESLHKRGWRRYQGRAPLAETLAAAMVLASGWDGRAPLLDPFCGSATVLIEAACIAANTAPGLFRRQFGFERLVGYDPAGFARIKQKAQAQAKPLPSKLRLLGWDRDAFYVDHAAANLTASGFSSHIVLEHGALEEFRPVAGWNAWIVTNPPYGERIGQVKELAGLYRRFGTILREACSGYHLSLLCGSPELVKELRLNQASALAWINGGIECELIRHEIP